MDYEPGFWCATVVRCKSNDACGGAQYYCTGDGLMWSWGKGAKHERLLLPCVDSRSWQTCCMSALAMEA